MRRVVTNQFRNKYVSIVEVFNVCIVLFADLKRRLAEWYQKEYINMPFIPSMQEYEVPMRQLYVAPKIVEKDDKNNSEVRINTFTDFLMKDGCLCKNIFLVGEPGTGKSTFTQNLALQWSELQLHSGSVAGDTVGDSDADFQDKYILDMIDILFHVSLRDANGLCSYVDIIRDQLLVHIYNQADLGQAIKLVQSLLECPTSCILSDGLDEWSHPEHGKCSCPSNVKGRTPVICQPHSAMTITTSRPWRMSQCPPKESKVEKRIAIEGTGSVESLGEKVVSILNERSGKHERFSEIKECVQEKGVAHLLTIPILLLQIVCLIFDGKEVSNSQSNIYASIFDMLMGRKPQEHPTNRTCCVPTFVIFADKKNVIRYWKYFTEIAKLAFEQLFPQQGHSSVVFNSNTCHLDDEVKGFALKYGILSEKKSNALSCRSSNLTFIHKSFQEFLTAVHLSLNEDLLKNLVDSRYFCPDSNSFNDYLSDLSQIFIFMCGLNKHIAELMSLHMNALASQLNYENADWCDQYNAIGYDVVGDDFLADVSVDDINDDYGEFVNVEKNALYDVGDFYKNDVNELIVDSDASGAGDDWPDYDFEVNDMYDFPFQTLTSLLKEGLTEADNNEINDFCPTLHYVEDSIQTNHDLVICSRLLDINKKQVIYLCIRNSNRLNVGSGVISHLLNFRRLKHLQLHEINLHDELQLPESVSDVTLDKVTVRKGLALEQCTMLKHLTLKHVNLADHGLKLPGSVSNIDLVHVNVQGGLTFEKCPELKKITIRYSNIQVCNNGDIENCIQLQQLKMEHVDLDNKLIIPNSVLHINLNNVKLSNGISLDTCIGLKYLTLQHVDLGGVDLQLPSSILRVELANTTLSRVISLKGCGQLKCLILKRVYHLPLKDEWLLPNDCTNLQILQLKSIDLGARNLRLPDSVSLITIKHVTLSGDVKFENCSGLKSITLEHVDLKYSGLKLDYNLHLEYLTLKHIELGDHCLQIPASVYKVEMEFVTLVEGLVLENCTVLHDLTLKYVDLENHALKIPGSTSSISLDHVTVPGGFQFENWSVLKWLRLEHIYLKDPNHVGLQLGKCMRLKYLTLKHIELGDQSLQIPASIYKIEMEYVTLVKGLVLENCTVLHDLTLKYVNLGDNNVKLSTAVTYIYFYHVSVTGGVSFQDCKNIVHLELKDVKVGEHELAIPDRIRYKKIENINT